jgi:hypothetical protein
MKFKINPERSKEAKKITSGSHKGQYEINLLGSYNSYLKAYVAFEEKGTDAEVQIVGAKAKQLSESTMLHFRDRRCYLNGDKWRVITGYSGSGNFTLLLRPEHVLDAKCDWYIKKYKAAHGKRKRNKFYKKAEFLHNKIDRYLTFYIQDRRGKYIYGDFYS